MTGNCHRRMSKEEQATLITRVNELVVKMGSILYEEGFCPVCGAETMIRAVMLHMREVSDVTADDMVHICMESVNIVYDIALVQVSESQVTTDENGVTTIHVNLDDDPKGRMN